MGLRLVYGRSGTGKSEFCYNEIATSINKNKKIYIITPEQFSFTAEKNLLEAVKKDAVINAEVLTFNRMAYRVISETGYLGNKTNLSDCGKSMLIYNILDKESKNLKFLGKSDKNIDLISNLITEFKKHNVTSQRLNDVTNGMEDLYLKTKLSDMNIIYENFQNSIRDRYIDDNDLLTILSNELDKTDEFKDTLIYIDEFAGFTPQEYEIIKKLLRVASQVTITVCIDSLEESSNKDTDIFYSNKLTVSKLIDLAKKEKLNIEKSICLDNKYRFKSSELLHLEENIYGVPYKKYEKVPKDLHLFLANNQYSEIEYVASVILKLVRDKGYRYKDISVITKNVDTYSSLIKAIFSKYEIPVFIDEKKDLSDNILVKYILALLEILSKNWSYEAVFNYIKTGLCDIEKDEIFILENYSVKWGIRGSKWTGEDWTFGLEDNEEINKINELRKKIVVPILEFKEKLSKTKDVKSITKAIYEFLIDNKIDVKINNKIKELEDIGRLELANVYSTSWNIIINVLDEIVLVFGEDKISFEKYAELLKVGLGESTLGKIPGTVDQVIIGDVDRSRSHKVKTIFIIGLNDGIFPSNNREEGFLDDKDRNDLKNKGIELAKGMKDKLYDDNYNIYKAFSSAEEEIYFSYASSNGEGKSLRPSVLISKVKKTFPKLIEKSDIIEKTQEVTTINTTFDDLLVNIKKLEEGEELASIWKDAFLYYYLNPEWKDKLETAILGLKYTNKPDKLNKENIEKLYGEVLHTSVSRLEQFSACPFSFYLKYGLKLSEKSIFKIESLDTGSFMHEVIEEFFELVKEDNIKIREISEEEIGDIIDKIIDEKLMLNKNYIFTSTPKYKLLARRLKRVIKESMKYIIESITLSDFDIIGSEVEFGKSAEYPSIVLDLEDNKKVEITGKIDRIDLAKNENGKYVRIVDYKSSIKNIDLNEVVAGLRLQLLTYLDAVSGKENAIPAGVLYFNLIDPIIKADKNMSNEQIEQEIRKKFKMQGLILADVEVVRMMDKTLDKGVSNIVPAYIDSSENLSYTRSSTVTKEQFKKLQKYTSKIIKEISEEILNGRIDITPYYNHKSKKTPCEYCDYRAICQFDEQVCNNEYNYIKNMEKQAILDEII